jgi:hypothetical protein
VKWLFLSRKKIKQSRQAAKKKRTQRFKISGLKNLANLRGNAFQLKKKSNQSTNYCSIKMTFYLTDISNELLQKYFL